MKKLFVIFLSSLYLVLTTGFTQTMHICEEMVEKANVEAAEYQDSHKPCPVCSSLDIDVVKKKDDCCKKESKIVKIDESLKKENSYNFSIKSWGEVIPNKTLGAIFDFPFINTEENSPYLASRLPVRENPLYILHCVFRI